MSEADYFGQLLALLHVEEMLRFERRCQMAGNHQLAQIFGNEIIKREGIVNERSVQ